MTSCKTKKPQQKLAVGQYLGAFAQSQKAPITLVASVRPSNYLACYQLCFHWTDYREIDVEDFH